MEHLNRTLKDHLLGLGANVSESTIIQISRSLRKLMAVTAHFDSACGIYKESIYHTCKDASKDLQLVVDELQKSEVFDHIPYNKTNNKGQCSVKKLLQRINRHCRNHETRI